MRMPVSDNVLTVVGAASETGRRTVLGQPREASTPLMRPVRGLIRNASLGPALSLPRRKSARKRPRHILLRARDVAAVATRSQGRAVGLRGRDGFRRCPLGGAG